MPSPTLSPPHCPCSTPNVESPRPTRRAPRGVRGDGRQDRPGDRDQAGRSSLASSQLCGEPDRSSATAARRGRMRAAERAQAIAAVHIQQRPVHGPAGEGRTKRPSELETMTSRCPARPMATARTQARQLSLTPTGLPVTASQTRTVRSQEPEMMTSHCPTPPNGHRAPHRRGQPGERPGHRQ